MLRLVFGGLLCLTFSFDALAGTGIEYYLWPATGFRATIPSSAACALDLEAEQNQIPTEAELSELQAAANAALDLIARAFDERRSEGHLSVDVKSKLEMAEQTFKSARQKFGFDRLADQDLDMDVSLSLVRTYDGFVPGQEDWERAMGQVQGVLAEMTAAGHLDPARRDEIQWNLSVLQQLASFYRLAQPEAPLSEELLDQAIETFFALKD